MKKTSSSIPSHEDLVRENADLKQRLQAAEECIHAIRDGEVDALVIHDERDPHNEFTVMRIISEESLTQSILEQVADAVVICNDLGIIERASNAVYQLCANPIGQHFDEVFTLVDSDLKKTEKPISFAMLLNDGAVKTYEVVLCSEPEEASVQFLLRARVLLSTEKQPVKLVITLTDITEGKKSEAILLEANRRKDEFLATLAHELRNPIAPLQNALSLITLPQTNSDTRERAHDIMRRQLLQMTRLVDDLLDISRITRDRIDLDRRVTSLSHVIDNAVETVAPLIRERNHKLSIKLPTDPTYINADIVRLSQVFSNVLNNAAKYTSPGGEILIHASVSGTLLTVSFIDNGIGIDTQTLPHIFDLFVQADYSLERSFGGLGIGLTLVKKLIEQHDGTINVKSKGVDTGCEFIITLPLCDSDTTQHEVQHSVEVHESRSLKILVVDDNTASADTIGWLLESLGHETHILYEGSKLVEYAREIIPDAILLDIGLPGKNGYDLCRELRMHSQLASTMLIAQTGWGQEKDKSRAIEAGFDNHLVKPFQLAELQALLELRSKADLKS